MHSVVLLFPNKDRDSVGPAQNGKRLASRKWGKTENQMENRLELDRGKNGPDMGFRGNFPCFLHFWAIFVPVKLEAVFHLVLFFPHFRLSGRFPFCAGPTESQNKEPSEFNSVQTRCIVKGKAEKRPLFWRFSGWV